jgi:Tol biopolymer transport system component
MFSTTGSQGVVQSLRTGERQVLIENGGGDVRYLPTGHLVYVLDGTLLAVPFDVEQLTITGGPVAVVEGIAQGDLGLAQFDHADDGTLVYQTGTVQGVSRTLVWVSRDGQQEEPLEIPPRAYDWPRVSPDGGRVIVDTGGDGGDLFLYNVETGVDQQFTTDPALDRWPSWSNDSSVVVFNSQRAGGNDLYVKAADGRGGVEPITSNPVNQTPYDLSADGRTLVLTEQDPDNATDWDIATLQIGDGSPSEKLLETDYLDGKPAISPNRRWMAYTSDELGGRYVYVRPFPDATSSDGRLITTDGDMPRWGPNGDELFYRTAAGNVMAVPVETDGDTFERGTPTFLFPGSGYHFSNTVNWDVAPDGRLLMIKTEATDETGANDIILIQHFDEELTSRFPDQ